MKGLKKIYSFLVMMLMVCAISIPAYAIDYDKDSFVESQVYDQADVLKSSDEESVLKTLNKVKEDSEFSAYIVIIEEIPDARTPQDYADDIYDASGCGYGDNKDGALLLICTKTRDWHISTYGFGKKVFTDKSCEYVINKMKPALSDDDYNSAMKTFADTTATFAKNARDGKKVIPTNWPKVIGISFIISVIISLIIVGIMMGELKTVKMQDKADYYTRQGSMKVTASRELFLYKTVEKTRKPDESSGSSSHTSSSGRSHGGSGGKF